MKKGKEKIHFHLLQQGGFSPLQTQAKVIAVMITLILLLSACCPPGASSSLTQETAFTATFLGFSEDGQYLLVKPERSSANVQMIFDSTDNLVIGQKIYVVGRLEDNIVYVNDLRPL